MHHNQTGLFWSKLSPTREVSWRTWRKDRQGSLEDPLAKTSLALGLAIYPSWVVTKIRPEWSTPLETTKASQADPLLRNSCLYAQASWLLPAASVGTSLKMVLVPTAWSTWFQIHLKLMYFIISVTTVLQLRSAQKQYAARRSDWTLHSRPSKSQGRFMWELHMVSAISIGQRKGTHRPMAASFRRRSGCVPSVAEASTNLEIRQSVSHSRNFRYLC